MTIGIVRSTYKDVKENLLRLLNLIHYKPKKKKVFIKPNIVDALPPSSAVIVNPKLTMALYEILQEMGFKEIVIGDGTGFFTKPKHFEILIKQTKYNKLEKKFGIKIVNLQHAERITKSWKYGEIKLPKIIFDNEFEYINLPKMKTHSLTTVTLSLKNQKGLLTLAFKRKFHKEALHDMIVELNKIVKPDLVIMDAITALEGTGPTENPQTSVKKMNLILGGVGEHVNVEMDNVAARIMGIDPKEIKHLPDFEYFTVGASIEEVKSQFVKPKKFVKYGNLIHHQNEKTCTLCQIALSQTLRKINFNEEIRLKFEELRDKYPRIDIIQGGGWESLPKECGKEILLGNCTKEFAESNGFTYCSGCPPHYNDIIDFFFKELG
ncbi:MAG: DUF362 domain-containing protein [Candidatus Helarchaeota archaeon]